MPVLDRALVASPEFQSRRDVGAPPVALLDLPEKVVQFGTGGFLRGFVEYFIDAANRSGDFGGRIVMVGSTGSGRDSAVNEQDGLYTLLTRGIEGGVAREEYRIIGSVSRALSAATQWADVLALARDPDLELVFSNTTEVGIVLDDGDAPDASPPRSFPGKLTRFLYERARAFDFDPDRGVVVVPCELITDNGDRLREIVLELARRWSLEPEFARWVGEAVPFCNTLVDRIVPPVSSAEVERITGRLGYADAMLTVCEPYRLFAIQADAATAARLRFAAADPGVVLTEDVTPYRERKVRVLNGAHTLMVPAALLAGCETVREAVTHPAIGEFARRAVYDEILPTLNVPGAAEFADAVFERFANPHIRHELFDITLQGTMKVRVRLVPSIIGYARRFGRPPEALAFGFAAYLLFMRGELHQRRAELGGSVPPDDSGQRVRDLWRNFRNPDDAGLARLARTACADVELWGTDLAAIPGFADAVGGWLARMYRAGVDAPLQTLLSRPRATPSPAPAQTVGT
ncbi:MAG TPA: tagaturonate reductase [Longimicrobiales bacterium]|nr:tagaturonate reductase [Longimicrobiales bacterium]